MPVSRFTWGQREKQRAREFADAQNGGHSLYLRLVLPRQDPRRQAGVQSASSEVCSVSRLSREFGLSPEPATAPGSPSGSLPSVVGSDPRLEFWAFADDLDLRWLAERIYGRKEVTA